MSGTEPAARIVFVHGTWGRRSPWTRPGSALHDRLRQRFPQATIERFEWSGKNRHRARAEAARELATMIERSSAPTILVGHSHGGSVVERALRYEGVGPRRPAHGVTVGTPFLRFQPPFSATGSTQVPVLDWGRLVVCLAGIVVGTVFLAGQLELDVEPVGPVERARSAPLNEFSEGLATSMLAIAAAALVPTVAVAIWFLASLFRRVRDDDAPISSFWPFDSELTVIRTRRDEAALGLRAGRLLGSAVEWSRRLSSGAAFVVGFAGFGFALFYFDGRDGAEGVDGVQLAVLAIELALHDFAETYRGAETATVMFATMTALGILGIMITLLAAFEAWFCGFDGVPLLRRGRVRIVGDPSPSSEHVEVTLSGGRGLRHSRLMSDPASIDVIVRACERHLTASAG